VGGKVTAARADVSTITEAANEASHHCSDGCSSARHDRADGGTDFGPDLGTGDGTTPTPGNSDRGFARMHADMTAILLIGVEKLISVGGDRYWKHYLAGRLQRRSGTAELGIVSEVFCILGDFVGDPRRSAGPSYFGLNLDTLTVARVLGLDIDSHVVDAFPVLRRHLGSHLVLRAGIAACDCVAREARVGVVGLRR